METRHMLLELFDAALRAVDGRACVARELREFTRRPCALFAVGKAASAMTRGALDALGDDVASALVVTKDGHADPALASDPRVRLLLASHPVPDARSLTAGVALENAVRALPSQ